LNTKPHPVASRSSTFNIGVYPAFES